MLKNYFRNLYRRTMSAAYDRANSEIVSALDNGGRCLDCGAHQGESYAFLAREIGMDKSDYFGIEWNAAVANIARERGLDVRQGDLNSEIAFDDDSFQCVFGLSVLEHLLNPCNFLRESYRTLGKGGSLVILTPNISTFFTMALLLLGKMPSSGPHPDSDALLKNEELFKVSKDRIRSDAETDTPVHRHLIVFSFRVLRAYLNMLGFEEIRGYGFGLYPFPNFMQPVLEKIDPYHCHQMVFIARK